MTSNAGRFSRRHGYRGEEKPITVREDAPNDLRAGLVMLADSLGLSPTDARQEVCSVLLVSPDPNNWSAYPNVFEEVQSLVSQAPWFRVYDIAEAFYRRIAASDEEKGNDFQDRLNELFCDQGIGWEMRDGRIVARGSEALAEAMKNAAKEIQQSGRPTAAAELHEAFQDLSRRPHADITGAIQHSMAALECVARDVTGQQSKTLGQLIPNLNLPKPLDVGVEKLWGYASEMGRHVREGRQPRFEEAELVVTVSAALSVYVLRAGKHG
jgi:hypothetical protein